MKIYRFYLCFGLLLFLFSAEAASEPVFPLLEKIKHKIIPNNGQDQTRPITRLDLRYQFKKVSSKTYHNFITFRIDKQFRITEKWRTATRVDVPIGFGNVNAKDNPSGKTQFLNGDILTEGRLSWLPMERIAVGSGIQLIWPTAYYHQGGVGKFQLGPLAGVRYFFGKMEQGHFIYPEVQYLMSYAGSGSRHEIRQIKFAPAVNFNLPWNTFAELYSSREIRYDFEKKAWFVPMNFMVGKTFRKKVVVSAEFFIAAFHTEDYKPYRFKAELRVGYFF